jgi:LPPG:FO 2-phospho-L-lactate transferase
LQEYLVRDRAAARVQGFEYSGIEIAKPAPGIEGAIREARLIVICPSNPFISVGPILAVPGMKQLLSAAAAPVVAVSPIVAGKAVKGPAGKMLEDLGCPVSAAGVAALYKGVADLFVLDRRDRESRGEIEGMGMKVLVAETMMHTDLDKRTLARQIIDLS